MRSKAQHQYKKELGCPQQEFFERLEKFSDFYLLLICVCIAICIIAIFVAVFSYVSVGLSICVLCITVYVTFTKDELDKTLGLGYSNRHGSTYITYAHQQYGSSIIIPSRLIFTDVIGIDDGAFKDCIFEQEDFIYLPRSIKYIGKDIFGEGSPSKILYEGSLEDWQEIELATPIDTSAVTFEYRLKNLSVESDTEESV